MINTGIVFASVGLIVNPVNGLIFGSGVAVGATVGVAVGACIVGVGADVAVAGTLVLVGSRVDVTTMICIAVDVIGAGACVLTPQPDSSVSNVTANAALDQKRWILSVNRYSPVNDFCLIRVFD